MERIVYYKKYILFAVAIIILGGALFWYFNATKIDAEAVSYEESEAVLPSEVTEDLIVDVKGAVKKPGIYSLKEGSRVMDAITAAGGLSKNGVTNNINLSKKLTNEMVVYIFTKSELSKTNVKDCNCEVIKVDNCTTTNDSITTTKNYESIPCEVKEVVVDNCPEINNETGSKININTADITELTSLPGIGEAKAKQIVEYRTQNGPFKNINDIKNVSGLGDALFEKIKNNITV